MENIAEREGYFALVGCDCKCLALRGGDGNAKQRDRNYLNVCSQGQDKPPIRLVFSADWLD
jgi:hypothetical protein